MQGGIDLTSGAHLKASSVNCEKETSVFESTATRRNSHTSVKLIERLQRVST